MNVKNLIVLFAFLFIGTVTFGQEIVRGELVDKTTGEGIVFASVRVDGVGKAKTDFDGTFEIILSPGNYVLTFSRQNEGYIDEKRSITVVAGNVLSFKVEMGKTREVEKAEVIVVGIRGEATIEGADKDRLDDDGASDGIPKEIIQQSGVTNAVGAVQMVPGASVEEGKNVYIRGLGDRYTKTVLNGMDIPGLDPDRNSVQLDIFPAVLLDNIKVSKTFTPNLTADFTGGYINIKTKDFPGRRTIYAKASLGYNTNATFNPNYISYKGGKLDFIGFDDGSRKLPLNSRIEILNPAAGNATSPAELSAQDATALFGKTLATEKAFSFLNQSYAFAIGDQKRVKSKKDTTKTAYTYGYNAVLNYRASNTYFRDVQYNEYLRDTDQSETRLFRDRTSKGEQTQNEVMWTALIGQSVKVKRSKYSLVLFHTQNGQSSAANLTETNFDSNEAVLLKQGLQYTQRSITNANLSGLHYLDQSKKWKLDWKLSPTYSRISDPDIRSTALELSDTPDANGNPIYLLEESVGAEMRRIFRGLTEYNVSGRMDVERKFLQWDSLESVISFGALNTYKNRTFNVNEYVFKLYNQSTVVPNDPNWLMEDNNLYTNASNQGVYVTGQYEPANNYQANQNTMAAYVMNKLPLSESFSLTYGARVEKNVNRYTGESNNAATDPNAPRYLNEVVLDELNILPSLNMVYKIRKVTDSLNEYKRSTNFRAAYTQTLARPSFREISISQIYDPIQGRRYLGNIDLKQTLIHNADIRWEHFFGRTELISLSGFYKKFINPIEIVANVAAPNEFKPVNAGEADVFGGEFEIRKTIGYKAKDKNHMRFVVGANFTYVVSRIDMNKVETVIGSTTFTEKQVREANARDGEVIGNFRAMYGQSPYIINAFATFKNDSIGLICNVNYNVQGKKLAVIGVGGLPDVYERSFHSLNLKVSKTFGQINEGESAPRWKASFRATNVLNFARRKYYEAYNAESQIFEYLHQGMTFTGSVSFTLR